MVGLFDQLSQVFPPKAAFTEKHVPNQKGKVYMVTGANTGLGKELTQILYSRDATVYMTARSQEKGLAAISDIQKKYPTSKGALHYVPLDLADLSTIKASAQDFLSRESRLHVLFNNAGVMLPDESKTSAQGYEMQLGVNNIGTQMFTELITPALAATAKTEAPGVVRVVWVSSSAGESPSSPKGGVPMPEIETYQKKMGTNFTKYAISKAGNYLQGCEYAARHKQDGIVAVSLNPGNLNSDLWRTQGPIAGKILRTFVLHPPINGAYTQLFAGLSPDVTVEKSGEWVAPFGRFMKSRKDLKDATKSKAEGGTGNASAFYDWCARQYASYI